MPQQEKPIDETPAYATPDIDMKIEPRIDTGDLHDFATEDEVMFKALEEVEKQIREKPSGWYSIPTDVSNPF